MAPPCCILAIKIFSFQPILRNFLSPILTLILRMWNLQIFKKSSHGVWKVWKQWNIFLVKFLKHFPKTSKNCGWYVKFIYSFKIIVKILLNFFFNFSKNLSKFSRNFLNFYENFDIKFYEVFFFNFQEMSRKNKKFPCIIESEAFLDTAVFTYLCDAFLEDVRLDTGLPHQVMKLHRKLAPYKVAIVIDSTSSY